METFLFILKCHKHSPSHLCNVHDVKQLLSMRAQSSTICNPFELLNSKANTSGYIKRPCGNSHRISWKLIIIFNAFLDDVLVQQKNRSHSVISCHSSARCFRSCFWEILVYLDHKYSQNKRIIADIDFKMNLLTLWCFASYTY